MKNIDRVKSLTSEELAMLLVSVCAETPVEFCTEVCKEKDCVQVDRCHYKGIEGETRAWTEWLEHDESRTTAENLQAAAGADDGQKGKGI